MPLPLGRDLVLKQGVVPEPTPDVGRLVFWLRGEREGTIQHWERIGTVPRTEHTPEPGIGAAGAVSIRATQQIKSFFGRLLRSFSTSSGEGSWLLPNGDSAIQAGEKQTDLLLVWTENDTTPLNETRVKTHWPQSTRIEQLGQNLFLIGGVESQKPTTDAGPPQPQHTQREQANKLLDAARKTGDRRQEASALTDLGILYLREGAAPRAVTQLEEALAIVRQLGDRPREVDVMGNLGEALVGAGHPKRGLELCEEGLAYARSAGNPYAEKTSLDHLGLVHSTLRNPAGAIGFYELALTIARTVGDWQHEVELLWLLAIQHAELGHRDQAIVRGQTAIDLLNSKGKPQAQLYAHHLDKFRTGATEGKLGAPIDVEAMPQGSTPPSGPVSSGSGPGLLRMALSAVKSMGKFLGSGMKAVTPEAHRQRQQTCATCEHHTGLRCKLCGCFTEVKAWLPHEDCPIGKWPSQ